MSKQTLEQRIVAVLNNPNASSVTVAEVLNDCEAEAEATERAASEAHDRARDLLAAPNAAEASQHANTLALKRDRLATILPKLQERLAETLSRESHERYAADKQRVQARRDAVAARWKNTYCECAEKMLAANVEVQETDAEIDRLNMNRPDGAFELLQKVELHARQMEMFTINRPSFLEVTRLFDFCSGEELWPPPTPSVAASFAASMVPQLNSRLYSADWAAGHETVKARQREDQQRVDAFNERRAREQEDSFNAEERARVTALRR
jgi:hypothetical protein